MSNALVSTGKFEQCINYALAATCAHVSEKSQHTKNKTKQTETSKIKVCE